MCAKKTPSMGTTGSVYSHVTRSTSNLKSTRSMRSLKIPWYRRPLVQDAYILDIQRGALVAGIYSLVLSIFTVVTGVFDIYSLAMAAPGSTHFGYYFISYQFVYVGNKHVRNTLILFAMFSVLSALTVLVSSIMLIIALRKEYEKKMIPWLYCFAIFTIIRVLGWLFFAIVNDLIFAYNILMVFLWALFCVANVYSWIVVYSLFLELADLTKLEDLAHLRMGTMQSLNASTTQSLAGSRPTTPHSTVSTQPVH
ncbi:protein pasi2 isoform X2 [Rhodnius prolixus]|uniref:protein pasi2 isoform X2 n=1 Tax=Rhodnius prolixus TaxID=13249 RepID=UPI003D18C50A